MKFFKNKYKCLDDVPNDIQQIMKYSFVIKYGTETVTGYCANFVSKPLTIGGGTILEDVILDLGDVLYHHSVLRVTQTPIILFQKEFTSPGKDPGGLK